MAMPPQRAGVAFLIIIFGPQGSFFPFGRGYLLVKSSSEKSTFLFALHLRISADEPTGGSSSEEISFTGTVLLFT